MECLLLTESGCKSIECVFIGLQPVYAYFIADGILQYLQNLLGYEILTNIIGLCTGCYLFPMYRIMNYIPVVELDLKF